MSKSSQSSNQATIAVANMVGQVGCTVSIASFAIIGLFFGLGYLLDSFLGTAPYIMLAAVILSFPVTLYAIVRLSLGALERANRIQERIKREQEERDAAEKSDSKDDLDSAENQNGKIV